LFVREVFWLSLRTKRDRKKDERKRMGRRKKKIFLLLPVCWHSILVGVWLKRGRKRREKQKNKKKGP
jgi:hypothetical protein